MLTLRLLGSLDLQSSDGLPCASVLSQPKRAALLAYLTLAAPGGFVRRDTLLGLLWPDSDTKRGRAALRQAIRFLRKHLGDEVVTSRGDEEVGVTGVACDAVDLRRAIARGDLATAVALYRGELLPGFFVDGADELDRWLHAERDQLRRSAAAAAVTVAERSASSGDMTAALGHAERAVSWSGDDETSTRMLMLKFDAAGHRSAALRIYDQHARQLKADLDADPSPELQQLALRMRAERGQPAPEPLSARRVLVVELENRTGDAALDHLGSMAADWIAQGLSDIGTLEIVPHIAALTTSRRFRKAAARDSDAVHAMAVDQRAGTVVSGVYYADGAGLQFHVRVTDAVHRTIRTAIEPVAAPREAPLAAIEALRNRVRASLGPLLDERVTHVAAATPPNYDAYRQYIEGLEWFLRGDWASALSRFKQAAAADPDYALPLIVSAITHWNLGQLDDAESAAARAAARVHTLRPFERGVLDMVQGWLRGDWLAAHDAAERQSRLAPHSIATYGIAEEARRLNRLDEALEVLQSLDPSRGEMRGWRYYWSELTTVLHLRGQHKEERDAAARARALFPDDALPFLLQLRAAAAMGHVGDVTRIVAERQARPQQGLPDAGMMLTEAGLELRAHGFREASVDFHRRALAWNEEHRPDDIHLAVAHYLAEEWERARADFEAAPDAFPLPLHHVQLRIHLGRGYLGALAVRRGDLEEAARIDSTLARMEKRHAFGRPTYWRAAMAALANRPADATSLLRQSFAEGLPLDTFIHTDVHFENLRTDPAYRELMRPR